MADVSGQHIPYVDSVFYAADGSQQFPTLFFQPIPYRVKIRITNWSFYNGIGTSCSLVLFFTPTVLPQNSFAALGDDPICGSGPCNVVVQGPTTIAVQFVGVVNTQQWGAVIRGEYLEQ